MTRRRLREGPTLRLACFFDELKERNLRAALMAVRAAGLASVCIRFFWLEGQDAPVNFANLEPAKRDEFRATIADMGLEVLAAGTGLGKDKLIGDGADVSAWSSYMDERVKPTLDQVAAWESPFARVFLGYYGEGAAFASHRQQIVDHAGDMAHAARERGVILVAENEIGLPGKSGAEMADILDAVNSPYLGACPDSGNFIGCGSQGASVLHQFNLLERWAYCFHLKDLDASDPAIAPGVEVPERELRRFVPAGVGVGAYPEIASRLVELIPSIQPRLRELNPRACVHAVFEPHTEKSEQRWGETLPEQLGLCVRFAGQVFHSRGLATDIYELADLRAGWSH